MVAESLGLGSHIMTMTELLFTLRDGEELKGSLGVPDRYKHICTVALGYKDESPRDQEEKM